MSAEMLAAEMSGDGGESRGSGGAIAAEQINSEWLLESYFFYPFLPAATYLFLPVSTRGSRQNETLTNKMQDMTDSKPNESVGRLKSYGT